MTEIANKSYVSKIEINLCNDEKSYKKKIKCLAAASSKPYENVQQQVKQDSSKDLAELQVEVKKAYELLRENKTSDATILLYEIVKGFEK